MIISQVRSLLAPYPLINAIITGIDRPSKNKKTGPMAQVRFSLVDINPIVAAETGADVGVCVQSCIHRLAHLATCYVNLAWQLSAWKSHVGQAVEILTTLRGRAVRFGEHGDVGAVSRAFVDYVISIARREHRHPRPWTAYTHAYDTRPDLREVCMASTDTIADRERAKLAGWRTFRPRPVGAPLLDGEIDCPYPTRGITCNLCLLCNGGNHGKDISIEIHH